MDELSFRLLNPETKEYIKKAKKDTARYTSGGDLINVEIEVRKKKKSTLKVTKLEENWQFSPDKFFASEFCKKYEFKITSITLPTQDKKIGVKYIL